MPFLGMGIYGVLGSIADTQMRNAKLSGKWELREGAYAYRFDTKRKAQVFARKSGFKKPYNLRQLP